MIKVLVLIKGLWHGGAENLVVGTLRHRDANRFEYEVAYLDPQKHLYAPELEQMGVPVHCLNGARGASWLHRLRRLVAERDIDVLHVHSPHAAVGARLAMLGRGTRIVYTEHNNWDAYHRVTYWANQITFPLNDRVFTVSDEIRTSLRYDKALRFLPMPAATTMYHGIDVNAFVAGAGGADREAVLGIPNGVPIVGNVANFRPEKGHRYLLEAAQQVVAELPHVRFVLVGSGPRFDEVRELVSSLSLERSVILLGSRSDVGAVMDCFDVFAMSSLYEGLPIALIEAMALGTPVVVTDAGGIPEVVCEADHGIVVPKADPDELARAILEVLNDSVKSQRLAMGARARAADFNIQATARRYEDAYLEVMAGDNADYR